MKTPCCQKTYCNDCITNALIESDFVCPACKTEGVLIDDLKPDDGAAEKIKEFLAEQDAKKISGTKSPDAAASPEPAADGEATAEDEAGKQAEQEQPKRKSPSPPAAAADAAPSALRPSRLLHSLHSRAATQDHGSSNRRPGCGPAVQETPCGGCSQNPKIPKAPKAMQQAQDAQQQTMMQQNDE